MKNNLLIPLVLLLVAIVCIIVGIVYLTRPNSTDDVNNKNNTIGKTCMWTGGSILCVSFLIYGNSQTSITQKIEDRQYSPLSSQEWTLESPI
jgi:hypothetical protein